MASLTSRNGVYYAVFTDATRKPRQRKHSLKTRAKRTAERLLTRLEEAYSLGEWDAWTHTPADVLNPDRVEDPKRVGEAATLYVDQTRETLAASTRRSRLPLVRRLTAHLGESAFLERVTPAQVAAFVNAGDAAPLTRRQRRTGVSAFFAFCVDGGMMKENPAETVAVPRPPAQLPRAVTADELNSIVENLPPGKEWCGPVFRFAALTGLRASELARLRWADVDQEQRLLTLETQKNGTAGTQPIPPAALDILTSLPRRNEFVFASPKQAKVTRHVPTFRTLLTMAFKAARDAAEIERPITLHGLRHGFCTRLAESGVSAFTIAAAARHGSVTTSQRYVSISNQHLRSELDSVFG